MPDRDHDVPQAVVPRVAALMRCLADMKGPVPLRDLAEATGLPKSTVHRLLQQLLNEALVERRDRGGYVLSLDLFGIGASVPAWHYLRPIVLASLIEFQRTVRYPVHLAVLRGHRILLLEQITPGSEGRWPTRSGDTFSAYSTGVGQALLASAPDSHVESVAQRGLVPRTPYTISTETYLRQRLQRVREGGLAVCSEESRLGITCLAAPVFAANEEAAFAISVMTTAARTDTPDSRLVRELRLAASMLAQLIRSPKATRAALDLAGTHSA